jgi:hypothetical protein
MSCDPNPHEANEAKGCNHNPPPPSNGPPPSDNHNPPPPSDGGASDLIKANISAHVGDAVSANVNAHVGDAIATNVNAHVGDAVSTHIAAHLGDEFPADASAAIAAHADLGLDFGGCDHSTAHHLLTANVDAHLCDVTHDHVHVDVA